jgi:hypothetical protein
MDEQGFKRYSVRILSEWGETPMKILPIYNALQVELHYLSNADLGKKN